MRKVVIILMVVLLGVQYASAQHSEAVLLSRVAEYVAKLGSYDVGFKVSAGEYQVAGSFSVAGDAYHIKMDEAEVFSDGKLRYEIDHERCEVSIDQVDLESRNILDNPTRCFNFVGSDYAATELKREGDVVTVSLVAQDDEQEGEIRLTLNVKTGCPLEVSYLLYDDRVDVKIETIESRKTRIKSFVKADYNDYDIVDFR